MASIYDLPNEVLALITASEHQALPQPDGNAAPHHLERRKRPGSVLEPILQPSDLAAWARTCRQFYKGVLPLLYEFNRTIQLSSAVAWAAHNGCVPTLEKSKQYGLSLTETENLYRPWPPFLLRPVQTEHLVHPVQFSLLQGHIEAVAWFLDHGGFNVYTRFKSLCPCPPHLTFPLHIAICGRQEGVVRLLVERGALLKYDFRKVPASLTFGKGKPIRLQTKFKSALHEAARLNQTAIVEYLVRDAGADVRSYDAEGKSVLECAIRNDDSVAIVKKLLELGASWRGRSSRWKDSALCHAITEGCFRVAGAIVSTCSTLGVAIPEEWRTKALLWAVKKTSPGSGMNYDSDTSSEDSVELISVNLSAHLSSSNGSSSDDGTGSYLSERSVSTTSLESVGRRVTDLGAEHAWNVERRLFMLKMIEEGVDINNNGVPILTFSQEAWVTKLLLDAGADPNQPTHTEYRPRLEYFPLGQVLRRHYHRASMNLWRENAMVLIDYGARIDQDQFETVVSLSASRHGKSKLRFLLNHMVIPKEIIDETMQLCLQETFVEGFRELTRFGGQAVPSKEAVYKMGSGLIRRMNKKLSKVSNMGSSSGSESDESNRARRINHELSDLTFLLHYKLSPIQLVLLLAQAIKQKVVDAAHILLDHRAFPQQETESYFAHLLILGAELGDIGIIRRLCSEKTRPREMSLALQMAVRANHRAVVLFFVVEGADVLHAPSPTTLAALQCLPEQEDILKDKGRWAAWKKCRSLRLADPLIHFDITTFGNRPVSALQLVVNMSNVRLLRSIMRCLEFQPRETRVYVHIPCMLADAQMMTDILATKGIFQD